MFSTADVFVIMATSTDSSRMYSYAGFGKSTVQDPVYTTPVRMVTHRVRTFCRYIYSRYFLYVTS